MKTPAVLAMMCLLCATPAWAAANDALTTPEHKAAYALGLRVGADLRDKEAAISPEFFSQGFKDGLEGAKPRLSEEEQRQALTEFSRQMQAKQLAKLKELSEKNLAEGQAFLKANQAKPEVKTTASGLQYKVLASGKGKSPKASDTVTVNYRGRLIDGAVFDDSYQRGQPSTFDLSGIIRGWQEALQLMKEGDRWELYIPSDLAFGPQGAGPQIGPNATLVFEVELIKVEPKSDQAPAAPAKDAKPAAKSAPKEGKSSK